MQNLRTVGQTVGLHVGAGKQLDLHHFTILNGDVYCYGGQGPTPVGVGGPPRGGKDVNSDGVRLLHTKAEVAAFRRAVPATALKHRETLETGLPWSSVRLWHSDWLEPAVWEARAQVG